VPNRSISPLATATMRKEVSESFSALCSAWPCSSSFTRACQNSRVSNSSRADFWSCRRARGQSLAAEVAFADDLHLRVEVRPRYRAAPSWPPAASKYRSLEFQQAFVHGDQHDLGTQWRIGAVRPLDVDRHCAFSRTR